MKTATYLRFTLAAAVCGSLLSACVSFPTLVQVARERQYRPQNGESYRLGSSGPEGNNGASHKNDVTVPYIITDLDVLNYTELLKNKLAGHCDFATITRYSSATGQDALTTLAGAASTAGWAASTASGFGLGATFISSIGKLVDAKGDAEAYNTAFTDIQQAENLFYFYKLGMAFNSGSAARTVTPESWKKTSSSIPSSLYLSADGEALHHRVVAVLKVLNAALAKKIPELQDLKDAKGDAGTTNVATPSAAPSRAAATSAKKVP